MDKLEAKRKQLARIDNTLVRALSRRMQVVAQIGFLKKKNNRKIKDVLQWNKVLKARIQQAKAHGLDPHFVKNIYERIHAYAVRVEKVQLTQGGTLSHRYSRKKGTRHKK